MQIKTISGIKEDGLICVYIMYVHEHLIIYVDI